MATQKKQWVTEPRNLPSSKNKRLSIKFAIDAGYCKHKYQGLSPKGFNHLFVKIFTNKEIQNESNFSFGKVKKKFSSSQVVFDYAAIYPRETSTMGLSRKPDLKQ